MHPRIPTEEDGSGERGRCAIGGVLNQGTVEWFGPGSRCKMVTWGDCIDVSWRAVIRMKPVHSWASSITELDREANGANMRQRSRSWRERGRIMLRFKMWFIEVLQTRRSPAAA